ncbi:MAG: Gfo/Idh/MocA family oxidoreductase [Methylobacillus sp.]|jgi:predicted dehydrogenase|nr:Gfo/Idh/MocA family oxidoreductase [Methylobacillus sp.]
METNRIRWGILGAARVNERLLPAIVEAGNSRLVAIASRRSGAAAETLAKYAPCFRDSVTVHETLEALLDDGQVQAVYLPMANHEHAEWALRAIAKGKHVLIEKPMALRVADIDAIEQAAKKAGVTVMEGFMYRFHPQHARIQAIIASGLIGEVRAVHAHYSFMMRPARMYRLAQDTANGGGAMWDIGPYAVHSSRLWFNTPPQAVSAIAKYAESGADITTSGIIDFGNGRHARFDVSFECSRQSEYTILGDKGGVKCHAAWQLPGDVPFISWWTDDGQSCTEKLPVANHFNLEIEHFCECVLNGKKPLLTFDDARANCAVINAALQSAAEGRTIRLSQ